MGIDAIKAASLARQEAAMANRSQPQKQPAASQPKSIDVNISSKSGGRSGIDAHIPQTNSTQNSVNTNRKNYSATQANNIVQREYWAPGNSDAHRSFNTLTITPAELVQQTEIFDQEVEAARITLASPSSLGTLQPLRFDGPADNNPTNGELNDIAAARLQGQVSQYDQDALTTDEPAEESPIADEPDAEPTAEEKLSDAEADLAELEAGYQSADPSDRRHYNQAIETQRLEVEQARQDLAVEHALAAREAAGGSGELGENETVYIVETGDSLWDISQESGASFADTIDNNSQIQNPDLIYAEQVIFVPAPVQGDAGQADGAAGEETQAAIDEALAAQATVERLEATAADPGQPIRARENASDSLGGARQAAEEAWQRVEDLAADELRASIPADQPFPSTVGSDSAIVQEQQGRVDGSSEYQRALLAARTTVNDELREGRTTSQELDKLLDDAREADNIASDPRNWHNSGTGPSEAQLEAQAIAREALDAAIREELFHFGLDSAFDPAAIDPIVEAMRSYAPDDAVLQNAVDRVVESVNVPEEFLAELATSAVAARDLAATGIPPESMYPHDGGAERWDQLQVYSEALIRNNGNGHAFPEEYVAEYVDSLMTELPDDGQVRETIEAAYAQVTAEWEAQGITRNTLGVIEAKYDDVENAAGALAEAQASGDAEKVAQAEQRLTDAREALEAEIETQMTSAGDAAYDDLITQYVDPELYDAVDTARTNLDTARRAGATQDEISGFEDALDHAEQKTTRKNRRTTTNTRRRST